VNQDCKTEFNWII